MKLAEFKGNDAIEVIADLIEPIAEIASDPACEGLFKVTPVKGESKRTTSAKHLGKYVPVLLKSHKPEVLKIVALLNGKDANEMNAFQMAGALLSVLMDKELLDLFRSAVPNVEEVPPTDTSEK
jgi:phosphohistidine phosphatase SixA